MRKTLFLRLLMGLLSSFSILGVLYFDRPQLLNAETKFHDLSHRA